MDEFTTPLPAFYEPASSPSPLCVLTIHTDFGSLDIPTATVAATLPVHPRKSKPAAQQGPDRGYPSKLRARASQKPYLKSTAPPRAMSAPLSNARAQSAPPGDTETSPSGFKLLSPFPEVIGAGARVRFRIPITREPTPTTLDRPRVSEVIDDALFIGSNASDSRDEVQGEYPSAPQDLISKPPGNAGRPGSGGYALKETLQWTEDTFVAVESRVHTLCNQYLDTAKSWAKQDPDMRFRVRDETVKDFPILNNYAGVWPVADFMQAYLKKESAKVRKTNADQTEAKKHTRLQNELRQLLDLPQAAAELDAVEVSATKARSGLRLRAKGKGRARDAEGAPRAGPSRLH